MNCDGGEPEHKKRAAERYIIMQHSSLLKTDHDELQVLPALKQEKILGKSFKQMKTFLRIITNNCSTQQD